MEPKALPIPDPELLNLLQFRVWAHESGRPADMEHLAIFCWIYDFDSEG